MRMTLVNCRFWLLMTLLLSGLLPAANANPIPADVLFANSDINSVKLSPNADYISMHTRTDDRHFIDVIKSSDSSMFKYIMLGDYNTKLLGYHWVNDHTLYITAKTNGVIYSLLADLTKDKKDMYRQVQAKGYFLASVAHKNDKVLYLQKRFKSDEFRRLYLASLDQLVSGDVTSGKELSFEGETFGNLKYSYIQSSQQILATTVDTENKQFSVFKRQLDDDKWLEFTQLPFTSDTFNPIFYKGNQLLYVLSNENSNHIGVYEYDLAKKMLGKLIYEVPNRDIQGVGFTAEGDIEYVTYVEKGITQREYVESTTDSAWHTASRQYKDLQFNVFYQNREKNVYLLFGNGPTEPGRYYIYSRQRGRVDKLIDPNEKLHKYTFYPTEVLEVTHPDSTSIEAFLTLPGQLDHKTLLVFPHGGPIGVNETNLFNRTTQYFASRGFAVLRVNFRGSANYGKSFESAGVGQLGKLIEEDITAAVNFVQKTHQFEHRCAMGDSYGGYSSVMLAIQHPDDYECAIGGFGIYDLPYLFSESNDSLQEDTKEAIERVVGQYKDKEQLVSPIDLLDTLKAPVLLIAGKKDSIASVEHTHRLNYLLDLYDIPHEMVLFNTAGHGFRYWRDDQIDAALRYDFIMRTLNIPLPKASELNATQMQAIGMDYTNIANAYIEEDDIDNDPKKALYYNSLAAQYGDADAGYNAARLAEHDEPEKAITMLQQAASSGHLASMHRLAYKVIDGGFTTEAWPDAIQHLQAMYDKENTANNRFHLATAYCVAPAPYKDIDKCAELIHETSIETFQLPESKLIRARFNGLIARTLFSSLTEVQHKKVISLILEYYPIIVPTELEAQKQTAGVFEVDNRGYTVATTEELRLNDTATKETFGIQFRAYPDDSVSYSEHIAMVTRFEFYNAKGEVINTEYNLLFGDKTGYWFVQSKVTDEDVNVDSVKLNIRSLKQSSMVEKHFKKQP